MAFAGMCPYFIKEKDSTVAYCECAKLKFPDRLAYRSIVYRYCGDPERFHECAFKKTMDDYYERKYKALDEKRAEMYK